MKNIELIQEKIEETGYADTPILDIQTKYFGDEVYIYIENDEQTCWKLSFLMCARVSYETDASWRPDGMPDVWWRDDVKSMTSNQRDYEGQIINVSVNSNDAELIDCALDLTVMDMKITCRDILVEKVDMSKVDFFWQHQVEKDEL